MVSSFPVCFLYVGALWQRKAGQAFRTPGSSTDFATELLGDVGQVTSASLGLSFSPKMAGDQIRSEVLSLWILGSPWMDFNVLGIPQSLHAECFTHEVKGANRFF